MGRAEVGRWTGLGKSIVVQGKKFRIYTGAMRNHWSILSSGSECSGLFSLREVQIKIIRPTGCCNKPVKT